MGEMLPLDRDLRHEGRAAEFLFANTIWAAVFVLAFAQTYCARFRLPFLGSSHLVEVKTELPPNKRMVHGGTTFSAGFLRS